MSDFKLLINGRLISGAETFSVINPATEEVLAEAPRADQAQLNEAVAAAKAAFPAWSAKPIRERGALLVELADALEANRDEFARLLTLEQGKPLSEAHWEIGLSIGLIRHHATLDLPNKNPEGRRDAEDRATAHAAWRRRGNRAVELSDAPARHQGCTGAARRRYPGSKAGANDASNSAPFWGGLWRDLARRGDQRHR